MKEIDYSAEGARLGLCFSGYKNQHKQKNIQWLTTRVNLIIIVNKAQFYTGNAKGKWNDGEVGLSGDIGGRWGYKGGIGRNNKH